MIVKLVERGVLGVGLVRHLEAVGLVQEGVAVVVAYVNGARADLDGRLDRQVGPGQGIAVAGQADYHIRALAHPVDHQLLVRVVQGVDLQHSERREGR